MVLPSHETKISTHADLVGTFFRARTAVALSSRRHVIGVGLVTQPKGAAFLSLWCVQSGDFDEVFFIEAYSIGAINTLVNLILIVINHGSITEFARVCLVARVAIRIIYRIQYLVPIQDRIKSDTYIVCTK